MRRYSILALSAAAMLAVAAPTAASARGGFHGGGFHGGGFHGGGFHHSGFHGGFGGPHVGMRPVGFVHPGMGWGLGAFALVLGTSVLIAMLGRYRMASTRNVGRARLGLGRVRIAAYPRDLTLALSQLRLALGHLAVDLRFVLLLIASFSLACLAGWYGRRVYPYFGLA